MLELQLTGGDVCKFYSKGSARVLKRKCTNPMMKIFYDNFFYDISQFMFCMDIVLLVMFVSSHLSCPIFSPIMNFLQFGECYSLLTRQ